MIKLYRVSVCALVAALAGAAPVFAQGRGGAAWTTVSSDAQRTSLTQPLLLPNIIAYKGFKSLAFVGGSSDVVYSIDYDLNRMFWQQKLSTTSKVPGTAACPGGLTAITRVTQVAPPAPAARGARGGGAGGGFGGGGRGPQIAN